MSEYDDKMKALRAELPQAYELKGQGEAGTGTITVPKGMTWEQESKYREAVQRRMHPDNYKKLDAIKKAAQEEHAKKIGKTRPTYFPKQEEDEATAYVRRAIARVHQKEPVSGPVKLSEQERVENAQMDFVANIEDPEEALLADKALDMFYDMADWKADTGLPPLKPGQKIVQRLGPDGEVISHIVDIQKDPFVQEREIDEEQYDAEYADQDPVESSSAIVDGKNYHKEVYDDGAVWLIPDDPNESPIREEDVTPGDPTGL